MIHALYGILRDKIEGHAYIETHGIEWDVQISAATLAALGGQGDELHLFTYMHVREDSMELFGFATRRERKLFQELISVSGIGPKQAMRILSGMPIEDLVGALDRGDVKTLASIKGFGQKTAQKVILALRDKLELLGPEQLKMREQSSLISEDLKAPHAALIAMGYDKKRALEVLEELHAEALVKGEAPDKKTTQDPRVIRAYEDLLFGRAIKHL